MTGTEVALVDAAPFELAWPGDYRRAETLTEIWLRSFRSDHTRRAYWRDLRRWLAWCEQCQVSPRDARIAHADMWIESQRADGCAEASIARRLAAVSSWYGYLIDNTVEDAVPLATRNPAKTRAKPKIDPDYSPTLALSQAEAIRLIAAADAAGVVASALIRLLLVNGLRIGSVLDSRIENLGHDRGHRTLTLQVKGGRKSRVAIPPMVGEAIDAMLAARVGWAESGPLFLTPSGTVPTEVWAWRLVRKLARAAAIPQAEGISPHSLRATAITALLDGGVSLRDAQDFAGHRDPRTTRRYDKSRNSLDRHGAYALAGQLGTDPGDS
jgi:integrase/recombinase XerD